MCQPRRPPPWPPAEGGGHPSLGGRPPPWGGREEAKEQAQDRSNEILCQALVQKQQMLAQDRQPKKSTSKHVPDISHWRRPPHRSARRGGASALVQALLEHKQPMTAPPPSLRASRGGEQKGAPYGGTHHKLLFFIIILSTLGIATEG
jgi:hypothetical protein